MNRVDTLAEVAAGRRSHPRDRRQRRLRRAVAYTVDYAGRDVAHGQAAATGRFYASFRIDRDSLGTYSVTTANVVTVKLGGFPKSR